MDSFVFITQYVFPVVVFLIMLAMGLTLQLSNFRAVVSQPQAFVIGLVGQMLLLPVVGIFISAVLSPPPEIAIGILLLAASPGGVTSNAIAFAARADLALSVALTATTSLLVAFSLPLWAAYALEQFDQGDVKIEFPLMRSVTQLALLTVLPVVLGILVNRVVGQPQESVLRFLRWLAVSLVCFLAASSAYYNIDHFLASDTVFVLISYCLLLMTVSMSAAALAARVAKLSAKQGKTIIIEVGVQNVAITLLFSMTVLSDPLLARIPVVYGMLMIIVPWVFVWISRHSNSRVEDVQGP
jgi:BASS family bile acid:Na+ symporter